MPETSREARRPETSAPTPDAAAPTPAPLPEAREVRLKNRVRECFGDLLDGRRSFGRGETVEFQYVDPDGRPRPCSFDVGRQTITIGDKPYPVAMPKGAKIDRVSFSGTSVTVEGSLGWFTGSGQAPCEALLGALDELVSGGVATVATENGKIVMGAS